MADPQNEATLARQFEEEKVRSAHYFEASERLIPPLLFRNGASVADDGEKINLIKLLGQMEIIHLGQGTAEYMLTKKAVATCLGEHAPALCAQAVAEGIFSELSNGYLVPSTVIDRLVDATGKSHAAARSLLQTTTPAEHPAGRSR